MPSEPKALVQAFVAAINVGDLTALDALVDPDYHQHDATIPSGRESLVAYLERMRVRWPAVRVSVDQVLADGDLVSAFTTIDSGSVGVVRAANVWKVRDGRLAEHWEIADASDTLRDLGDVRTGKPVDNLFPHEEHSSVKGVA